MWCDLKNNMTAYAVIKSPSDRLSVAESLNLDLSKIESWCNLWGMCLNPRKSTSIVNKSRSRILNPPHPNLIINIYLLAINDSFKLLGVLFDNKLTFEKHIRSVASSIAQKVGILRKCLSIYDSNSILKNCFFSFILPLFEYCTPVWRSAAETLPSAFRVDLCHRCLVGSLPLF